MNNEHNPIAIRIGNIQTLWDKARKRNPNIRLFSLVSQSEDYPLVEGFFRLESSPYGKTEDFFIVFFIDFNDKQTFYEDLIRFWLDTFDKDLKKNPHWVWSDFIKLKDEFNGLEQKTESRLKEFYIKLVSSFQKFKSKHNSDGLVVISLIIRKVTASQFLNEGITELVKLLPIDTALLLYDYKERELYAKMVVENNGLIVEIPNQNTTGAYQEIATQGNPNDPQVKFRKLVFELGEAAKQKKRGKVIRIGNELIETGKKIGELSSHASAYLIFSSFLFQFKKEKDNVQKLLDTGISIVKPFYKEKKDCAGIFLQLLMFKASHYNIIGKYKLAIDCFMQYITYAKDLDEKLQVITGYNYVLLIALKKDKKEYKPILEEAFQYGYAMNDEILKAINLTLIADNYIKKITIEAEQEKEIRERMTRVYGDNWQDSPKTIAKKMRKEYELNP